MDVPARVYGQLDSGLFDAPSEDWWRPDTLLFLMRTTLNPVRTAYAREVLFERSKIDPSGRTALEIGCGGGYLTEEVAGMGFATTGIDPVATSVDAAREHAASRGLDIRYDIGRGESLPYGDETFDVVLCCDVLEHVRDPDRVVAEAGRTLKRGGIFFYDTLNRTWLSKIAAIGVCQRWKRWAILPERMHVWDMFIRPAELKRLLDRNGLAWQEHVGTRPNVSIPRVLGLLRKRARHELSYHELGEVFTLQRGTTLGVLYMGYAVKGGT
jgi:2-polyprenyl-6-hydroxyphenyl methylase / 3-demethylubiquinone-9 3-methyltransferase